MTQHIHTPKQEFIDRDQIAKSVTSAPVSAQLSRAGPIVTTITSRFSVRSQKSFIGDTRSSVRIADGSRKELAKAAPKLAALHYYLVTYPGTNVQELHAVGIWAK